MKKKAKPVGVETVKINSGRKPDLTGKPWTVKIKTGEPLVHKDVLKADYIHALLVDAAANRGIKLDIACGASKQGPDWIGIDFQKLPGVDIVHDIEEYPWPLPDDCVELAIGSHIAEHINPAKFGFVNWMNEIHRVLKVGARLMLALPYGGSPGYWQDPTHCNGCNQNTWNYFDPLHPSGFYRFYRPRPWKIVTCSWDQQGFMEVVLEKRADDGSYHAK